MHIPYKIAVANSAANQYSKFPTRKDNRLEPVAEPDFSSGIWIKPGDKVVTMGSCFARNIEEYLASGGFVVPVLGYDGPSDEAGSRERIQSVLNKYTVASIYQELMWVKSVSDCGGKVTWNLVEPFVFEVGNNQFLDLQLSTTLAVSKSRLIERRQRIYDIHVQIFNCDLAVLTPGLTEAWYDSQNDMYIQRIPTRQMIKSNEDRYFLEILDFFKCYDMLERVVQLLHRAGTRQIALTVSPVPLARTMTSKDVLVANMYSKSTLRSVVGLLSDRYDFVHYVPSYEKVMLSRNPEVWKEDLQHVADSFVGEIVSAFVRTCSDDVSNLTQKCIDFNNAFKAGRKAEAKEILDMIGSRVSSVRLFRFHINACSLLMELSRFEDAMVHAKALRTIRPHKAAGYVKEFHILAKQKNMAEARKIAEEGMLKCDKASKPFLVNAIRKYSCEVVSG
jgi:hypothetical protein